LVQIQKAYLQPRDWKGAQNALETVLKLALDERTQARARFYLGLSLARQGDYQPAFLEFLAARDAYPEEATPFIEALFSRLDVTPR
jgi:TolA-binding protein